VKRLKAGFDFELLRKETPRPQSQRVSIVYATSRIVDTQYLLFTEAMKKVLDLYADKIELTIWGCQSSELVGYRGVTFAPLISDYDRFLREFSRHGFDIGLAPLEDTPFHRSKTNTKFRDYGACRVAGIYSNVPVYSSCVEHERTGYLVENTTESWFSGMCKLIEDASLRNKIQSAAYDEVYDQYRQQVVEDEWMVEIQELLSKNTAYSLYASSPLRSCEVLIRADFNNLAGVKFPDCSPGDRDPVGKVYLEVRTAQGNLLREASTTKRFDDEEEAKMGFSFEPIKNSQKEEFVLKFTSVPENQTAANQPFWLPSSGYIQMVYRQ
jgi:hypothetical protein